MGQGLRILFIEDVEADAVLAARELKRSGMSVEARRVDREDDLRRELLEFRPQIILSDFNMPQFDGMAALAIARETAPEVPFIFVSGTLGEEYAIRALRNGAVDYVLKTNLVRLPPAVERAMSEAAARAQRRRGEQLLALEHTVVRHLADADSAPAGLGAVIRSVCETEGWDLGRYFRVDEKAGLLRFVQFWSLPDAALEEFVEASREMTFIPGAGLMGLAWQEDRPLWSTDTQRPLRRAAASTLSASAPLSASGFSTSTFTPALSIARALFRVSWYSVSGSESATIPAPAVTKTFLPFMIMVRITMQVSRFPL